MGLSWRRSKTFGPLRVTASKRGIGWSLGAGGVRLGRTATGRRTRTVRVPGTGLSWRSSAGTRRKR